VLIVAAVTGAVVVRQRAGTAAPGRNGSGGAVAVPATITSLDPSGGSGFRKDSGSTWRTQTYQSADFGNLKDGVGLLLDLGSAREVTTVALEVVGGPIAVELRAGDARAASAAGYRRVARADSASGPTTLTPEDAGRHRYWLVWVTRLASQDGGYRAVVRDPAVKARTS
jgi:putative peptidoglycan lipid II flippase